MHITGCNYRFLKLLSKLNDLPVYLLQVFFGTDHIMLIICYHKSVISNRLDLQVIIEFYQPGDLRIRLSVQQGTVQFSRFAGTSQDQTLSVFQDQALGNPGMLVKIGQM